MGISINIAVQLARIAPLLEGATNGVMLGRQKMHFPPHWKPRLVRELARLGITAEESELFQEDGFCEAYLRKIGWPPMESLDFMDTEGAEYVHDLGEPVPDALKQKFDIVYDGGTTEHIFDIATSLRNAHEMLRPGGVFVSCVGADGWYGHGFYQIGPDVPWRYWHASLGYDVLGCWTFARGGKSRPEVVADPTGRRRGGRQEFDGPRFIFYAVRKPQQDGQEQQIVQSHYVKYVEPAHG